MIIGTIVSDVRQPYKRIDDALTKNLFSWLKDNTHKGDRWIIFGEFGKNERAPDLYYWGGSAAKLRCYTYLFGKEPYYWAPDPAQLEADQNKHLWLIVYRDNKIEFPEHQWSSYKEKVIAKLGAPRSEKEIPFKRPGEGYTVLEFCGKVRDIRP